MRRLTAKDIESYNVDHLDLQDHPDYCDARIYNARAHGKYLSDEELDYLHKFDPGGVNDLINLYVAEREVYDE